MGDGRKGKGRGRTGNDLVTEPDPQGAVEAERGDHAGADAEEDHAGEDEGVVVADGGDEAAGGNGRDDDGDEHGEQLDAGLDGGVALDGLEVEGCCMPW